MSLAKFIKPFILTKDSDLEWTHTVMIPMGDVYPCSLHIPKEKQDEFIDRYSTELENGSMSLGITEKHGSEHSVMFVDVDFRWKFDDLEVESLERIYKHSHVQKVVNCFIKSIMKFANEEQIDDNSLNCYYLNKHETSMKNGMIADGFHLQFPNLWMTYDNLFAIFDDAVQELENDSIFDDLNLANPLSDVMDKAPLERNALLLYGGRKANNKQAYCLQSIFKYTKIGEFVEEVSDIEMSTKKIINMLSIRRAEYSVIDAKDSVKVKPRKVAKKVLITDKYRTANTNNEILTDELIKEVKELLNLIDDKYCDDTSTWFQIGKALVNIHPGLIEIGKQWSERSDKYEEGCCEKHWKSGRSTATMGTLIYYAKQSDPTKYAEWKKKQISHKVKNSPTKITNNDTAKLLHSKFSDTIVCSSMMGTGEWFKFNGQRYRINQGGIYLRTKMSEDLVNEYKELVKNNVGNDKAMEYLKCIKQLKTRKFKDDTMSECKEVFYDDKFYESLDQNRKLIGFENGVLDLSSGEFRDGLPEDRISISTKIDFKNLDDFPKHQFKQMMAFLNQILPYKELLKYVLTYLSSCLEGGSLENFLIWTGSGGNGKSKLLELFLKAMGDYTKNIPVSLLTSKRNHSSSASPELAQTSACRMVYFQEPDENSRINIGLLKELSGGDKIQVRALYKEPFEFKPQFKMLMLCNKLPEISATDGGTWRRMKVVPFTSEFVDKPDPKKKNQFKKDYDLSDKLESWKEMFMALLVDYYFNVFKIEGLQEPDMISQYTKKYQEANDHYEEFIKDNIKIEDGQSISKNEMYSRFQNWYREATSEKPPKKTDVIEFLQRHLHDSYDSKKRKFNNVSFIDEITEF